jgi:hypothetical protein
VEQRVKGLTPLGFAVQMGKEEAVKVLLNAGASLATTLVINGEVLLPTTLAQQLKNEEVLAVLREHARRWSSPMLLITDATRAAECKTVSRRAIQFVPVTVALDAPASKEGSRPMFGLKAEPNIAKPNDTEVIEELYRLLEEQKAIARSAMRRLSELEMREDDEAMCQLLEVERQRRRILERELDDTLRLAEAKDTRVRELEERVRQLETSARVAVRRVRSLADKVREIESVITTTSQ